MMKRIIVLASALFLSFGSLTAQAASDCEAKAVSKDGKPLAGAAKTAFMKKCEGEAAPAAASGCEEKAVSKKGKPLAGAAKAAFMKKCEKDAAAK